MKTCKDYLMRMTISSEYHKAEMEEWSESKDALGDYCEEEGNARVEKKIENFLPLRPIIKTHAATSSSPEAATPKSTKKVAFQDSTHIKSDKPSPSSLRQILIP